MGPIQKNFKKIFFILSISPVLMMLSSPALAILYDPATSGTTGNQKRIQGLKLFTETRLEYADNVFRLTGPQKTEMKINDQEDVASSRYKDMDSISDFILEPSIELKFESGSPLGGKFRLSSWIRYNYYLHNNKSGFPEGKIELTQSLFDKGEFSLEGNFLHGFFKKNYLSGAIDINKNGNISRDERIYSPAIYNEFEGIAAYEYKIIKAKGKGISGLNVRPFIGYSNRSYHPIFSNRSLNTAFWGLGLNLEFISKVDLELIYQYESVSSADKIELILFDETVSGTDVNNDRKSKSNAPFFTNVDRSCNRYTLEINPSFQLTKDSIIFIGYKRRISEYKTDNILDVDRFDQRARRQEIKSGINYSFSKAWSGQVEYARTDNNDEEDGKYSQNNFLLSIKYSFY
jgi:hypothetical protein